MRKWEANIRQGNAQSSRTHTIPYRCISPSHHDAGWKISSTARARACVCVCVCVCTREPFASLDFPFNLSGLLSLKRTRGRDGRSLSLFFRPHDEAELYCGGVRQIQMLRRLAVSRYYASVHTRKRRRKKRRKKRTL